MMDELDIEERGEFECENYTPSGYLWYSQNDIDFVEDYRNQADGFYDQEPYESYDLQSDDG